MVKNRNIYTGDMSDSSAGIRKSSTTTLLMPKSGNHDADKTGLLIVYHQKAIGGKKALS